MAEHCSISVRLEGLDYRYDSENFPEESPHVFIYTITIQNHGQRAIKLLGRKWVIRKDNGEKLVIEGQKIVGQEPHIEPGERFTYNSFHLLDQSATADGSYFGTNHKGQPIVVPIPSFVMKIPHE